MYFLSSGVKGLISVSVSCLCCAYATPSTQAPTSARTESGVLSPGRRSRAARTPGDRRRDNGEGKKDESPRRGRAGGLAPSISGRKPSFFLGGGNGNWMWVWDRTNAGHCSPCRCIRPWGRGYCSPCRCHISQTCEESCNAMPCRLLPWRCHISQTCEECCNDMPCRLLPWRYHISQTCEECCNAMPCRLLPWRYHISQTCEECCNAMPCRLLPWRCHISQTCEECCNDMPCRLLPWRWKFQANRAVDLIPHSRGDEGGRGGGGWG